jgi:uncharacterized protein DUF998
MTPIGTGGPRCAAGTASAPADTAELLGRGRNLGVGALVLVALAACGTGYLELGGGRGGPVAGMVSEYAFSGVGVWLLPATCVAAAAGLVVLAVGLTRAGTAGAGGCLALVVAGAGLVLVAAFRADEGAEQSARGLVHRAGGGLVFAALPVAGRLLARRFATRPDWRGLAVPVQRLSGVSGAVLLLFLLTYLPGYGVPLPGGGVLTGSEGLAERAVLLVELVPVVLVAARLATGPEPAGSESAGSEFAGSEFAGSESAGSESARPGTR